MSDLVFIAFPSEQKAEACRRDRTAAPPGRNDDRGRHESDGMGSWRGAR
jgi:hypothetical protein